MEFVLVIMGFTFKISALVLMHHAVFAKFASLHAKHASERFLRNALHATLIFFFIIAHVIQTVQMDFGLILGIISAKTVFPIVKLALDQPVFALLAFLEPFWKTMFASVIVNRVFMAMIILSYAKHVLLLVRHAISTVTIVLFA